MNNFFQKLLTLGLSKTARHTYLVFGGDSLFTVTTFFTTIIIARGLSISEFGVFIVLSTILVLVSDVVDFGVGNALSHFLPTYIHERRIKESQQIIKAAMLFEFAAGIVVAALSFPLGSFFSQILFHSNHYGGLVGLTGIIFALSLLTTLMGFTLSALERFDKRAMVVSLPAILRLVIVLILFLSHTVTLTNILLTLLVSFLPSLIFGYIFIGHGWVKESVSSKTWRTLFSFASFIGVSKAVTALASRLDVIMLSVIAGVTEAGIYGGASRLTLVYPMLAGSFSAVIAPKIAKTTAYADLTSFLKKSLLVTVALLISAVVLIILAPVIIPVVFGSRYAPSISVFQLLLLPNMLFIATIPTVNFIIYRLKKTYVITITSVIQLIIIVLTNLLFIPTLGRFGPIPGLTIAFGQVLFVTAHITIAGLRTIKKNEK